MMIDNSNILLQRRADLLIDCYDKPVVVIDSEGYIINVNTSFVKIIQGYDEDFKKKSIFLYCDEKASKEIKRIIRHRSLVGPFVFKGALKINSEVDIQVSFTARFVFDEEQQTREILLFIEPEIPIRFSFSEIIKYFGEIFLPKVPTASQIIDTQKKVLYSVNWDELPEKLREINKNERICCYLLKKSGTIRECVCEKALRTGDTLVEEVCIETDEGPYWLAIVVLPLVDENNSVKSVIVTLDNITEERRMAKNIEKYLIMSQQNLVGPQFSIALARHLRNPLTVMVGAIEILEGDVKDTFLKGVIEKLKKNCEICKSIVNQIFNFNNVSYDGIVKTEINALIRSMVLPIYATNSSKNVVFRFSRSSLYVNCIPQQIAQAFISIINNAIKYAENEVMVEVNPNDLEVTISIMDDGPGIPENIKNKIFEPFFTTDDNSKTLGLGLTLARTAIEFIGGRIEIKDSHLGGANFVIHLPLVDEDVVDEVKMPPTEEKKTRKLLLIEDEKDLQHLVSLCLQKEDIKITNAYTSDEAIEYMDNERYDVIIIDVQLPGSLNGYQLYEQVCGIGKYNEEQIIVITADILNLGTQEFLKKIKSPYLEKPFQFEDLKNLVHQILNR